MPIPRIDVKLTEDIIKQFRQEIYSRIHDAQDFGIQFSKDELDMVEKLVVMTIDFVETNSSIQFSKLVGTVQDIVIAKYEETIKKRQETLESIQEANSERPS